MTESEWITSEDPAAMLRFLRMGLGGAAGLLDCPVSDRKLRLFACACCRQVWHLLTDPRSRNAVEVAEQFADGETIEEELNGIRLAACVVGANVGLSGNMALAADAASNSCQPQAQMAAYSVIQNLRLTRLRPVDMASLLREIVGTPWRPMRPLQAMNLGRGCDWLTPTVVSLAEAAYEDRPGRACDLCAGIGHMEGYFDGGFTQEGEKAPDFWSPRLDCRNCHGFGRFDDGTLDNVRLAILADALEEAGCNNEDVLSHLRSPEPHVRGCWVLDLVLGKR